MLRACKTLTYRLYLLHYTTPLSLILDDDHSVMLTLSFLIALAYSGFEHRGWCIRAKDWAKRVLLMGSTLLLPLLVAIWVLLSGVGRGCCIETAGAFGPGGSCLHERLVVVHVWLLLHVLHIVDVWVIGVTRLGLRHLEVMAWHKHFVGGGRRQGVLLGVIACRQHYWVWHRGGILGVDALLGITIVATMTLGAFALVSRVTHVKRIWGEF